MKHASIIPLIGGETIGCEYAFGSPPDYFLSYEPFQSNDQHILNYYNKLILIPDFNLPYLQELYVLNNNISELSLSILNCRFLENFYYACHDDE